MLSTKKKVKLKKKKENNILTEEKERKHDLDQEKKKVSQIQTKKKASFKILIFSFINSHLSAANSYIIRLYIRFRCGATL